MNEAILDLKSCNTDIIKVKEFLAGYDSAMRIYDGDYKAAWLLSDVHSPVWKLKTNKTISLGDQKFKYTHDVLWGRELPNRTYLTDFSNRSFLEFIQQAFFIYTESPNIGSRYSATGTLTNSSLLLGFISWLFLYEEIFKPSECGLSKLTDNHINEYIKEWCMGGSFLLLRTGHRIIEEINSKLSVKININSNLSLSKKDIDILIRFFTDNDCYGTTNYGAKIIDRKKIRDLFSISKQEFYSYSSVLFFRQFEPEILALNDKVLLPLNLSTEFPSHKTPLISDILGKIYSKTRPQQLLNLLCEFMKLKPLFPALLPNSESFHLGNSRKLINRLAADSNTTPWIPLPICLQILNKSIDIVIHHGDSILEYLDKLLTSFTENNAFDETYSNFVKRNMLVTSLLPESLECFGIETFGKRLNWTLADSRTHAQRLRENPSVCELVEVLLGACLIIVAALKPLRVDELSSLNYDCLSYKDNDGFWLSHSLKKSGINDNLPETQKPIPRISANAIQLLQKFNIISQKFALKVNEKEADYLLYGLTLGGGYLSASIKKQSKINQLMSLLCDYANLETDEFGRRWYVNTHELRKSFLLTFFWTFKFSSLDACRWIAGHKDPDHVLRYIESNMPGEEMVEVEAEYVYQQLRLFNFNNSLTEVGNIESLCDDVCKHFSVDNISEVPEKDLMDWVHLSIEKGIYSIEVFGLDSLDDSIDVRIAFKIQEKHDDSG